jgi:uncharacterized membrane protein YbhN (UPF0104 family)
MRLLGPLLLAVLLWRLPDKGRLWTQIGRAHPGWVALAVALTFANLHLKVLRWRGLVGSLGARLSLGRSWTVYLASSYVGLLTPGRVGDALRARYLKEDTGLGHAVGLGAVVVDRLCDLWVLGLFSALALLRWGPLLQTSLGALGWLSLGLVAAGPLLLSRGDAASWLEDRPPGFLRALLPSALQQGLAEFLRSLSKQRSYALRGGLGLTLGATSLNYLQGWLLARALGVPLSLADAAGLLAVVSLLGLLPVSVAGLGLREVFLSLAFPALGFEASAGLSFGLLVFGVLNLSVLGPGFVAFQRCPPPLGPLEPSAPRTPETPSPR